MNLPEVLTPTEVATYFKVNPKTVARWAKDKRIPSFQTPGGHHRFRREDILAVSGSQMIGGRVISSPFPGTENANGGQLTGDPA
jgi:excisionase family DNA binding protein